MSNKSTAAQSDPLLQCLSIILQLQGQSKSPNSLKVDLPIFDELITPQLFIQAANNADLDARYVKRDLTKIAPQVLPVVLQLKNQQACVLVSTKQNKAVVIRSSKATTEEITLQELSKDYDGYIYLIKAKDTIGLQKKNRNNPAAWFWNTFWDYKNYYSEVALVSLFINIFALALPLFIMNVYDRVVPNNAIETLWVLASGIAIIMGFDYLMKTFRVYYVDLANEKIDVLVSSLLFQKLLRLDMEKRKEATGTLSHKILQFDNIASFLTSSTLLSIFDFPFVILFLLIIAFIAGWMVIIPLAALPIVIIISYLASKPMRKTVQAGYVHSAKKQSVLIETIKNIDMLKSVVAESMMLKNWESSYSKAAKSGVKSRYYQAIAMNSFSVINTITVVLIIIAGVYSIQENTLSIGGLIACTLITSRIMAPFSQILSLLIRYHLAKHSLTSLTDLMNNKSDRDPDKNFLYRKKIIPCIEFKDVNFQYQGSNMPLFKEISFKIEAGESVGIVGPMGVGKSTILKLMMGFYQPSSGSIHLSNTDLSQLDPVEYRLKTGYVQQEPRLIKGTAKDNIVLKTPWASDDDIIAACELSGAYDFINSNPKGFDMEISEDGIDLSGGQRQTIVLARALMSSPDLLLFDEPCNSIDSASEQKFIERMINYTEDKTLILVTHRMTLLPLVSRLIVIKDGKILADGPRDQVIEALTKTS